MMYTHKPKTFRSPKGCCICRAKSSSSRFTDSKKYEPEFERCFKITKEKRSGEICNACVLLVKRWKKLPSSCTKNWSHVVDARAGPGLKSLLRYKSKLMMHKRLAEKNKYACRSTAEIVLGTDCTLDRLLRAKNFTNKVRDEFLSDLESIEPMVSPSPSPVPSDMSDDSMPPSDMKPKPLKKRVLMNPKKCSAFVDTDIWKQYQTCCGIIFKGPCGVALIDQKLYHPCSCKHRVKANQGMSSSNASEAGTSSDSALEDMASPSRSPPPEPEMFEKPPQSLLLLSDDLAY